MTKAQIRKEAAILRNSLSENDVNQLSLKLLTHFTSFDLTDVKVLHIFLPIFEKKEPDTFLIIDWLHLHRPDIKIIVPKADFDTALMSHHEYPGKEGLIKNLYNILEPEKGNIHTGEVDMVLVPMLSFDQRGYRVGYGKGFYDRFLQGLVTRKVGLCFHPPYDEIEDIHENDINLDQCITPDRIYSFNSSKTGQ